MQLPPIDNPFAKHFREPLTASDIEEIEEAMNVIVNDLFGSDPQALEEELEAPLAEKIEGCIDIADYAATDPVLKDLPGVQQLPTMLRDMLTAINVYYNQLN